MNRLLCTFALSLAMLCASATASPTEGYEPGNAVAIHTTPQKRVPYSGDIWQRIRAGFAMKPFDSWRVKRELKIHSLMPRNVQQAAERSGKFLYHIVGEVEERGLPTELALLPFVESAFQSNALSRAKASGLWQFTPSTASIFSLTQNMWKDDRRDVLESTRAALDYLEKLYAQFGDWQLALAAYNWGEGNVQKALRKAMARGRPADYAHIKMPRETANYIPKLEAIKRIILEPERYNIRLPEIENVPYFVQITKQRDVNTDTVALLSEMDKEDFRELNPSFNLPVIVANHNASFLLPTENLEVFLDNLASWLETGKPLSSWTLHRVQSGETLQSIATAYLMSPAQLRRVNHIPRGHKVLAGSALLVLAHEGTTPAISEADLLARISLARDASSRMIVYRVKKGDTLSSIAAKHHISQESIEQENNLNSLKLKIGQRLILSTAKVANPTPPPTTGMTHRVRYGETLSMIAKRYRTTTTALRQLNDLESVRVVAGQTLRVR